MTYSRSGHFVAFMRRRRSSSASCGTLTRKGRIAVVSVDRPMSGWFRAVSLLTERIAPSPAACALTVSSAWAPLLAGCCASTVTVGARDTVAAKNTTRKRESRPMAPVVWALVVYCAFSSCTIYSPLSLRKNRPLHVPDSFGCDKVTAMVDLVWRRNPLRDLKNCPALPQRSFTSFYLLSASSFTAPVTPDYGLSKRAIHHEIEWFLATTFKGSETSHYRGIPVRFCGAVFDQLPCSPPYFLL